MSGMTVCAYRSSENFFSNFCNATHFELQPIWSICFLRFFNFSLTEHFGSHWLNYKATNLSKSRTSNSAKTIFVGTKMSFMVMISWVKVYIYLSLFCIVSEHIVPQKMIILNALHLYNRPLPSIPISVPYPALPSVPHTISGPHLKVHLTSVDCIITIYRIWFMNLHIYINPMEIDY